jgi:hypothetical protein
LHEKSFKYERYLALLAMAKVLERQRHTERAKAIYEEAQSLSKAMGLVPLDPTASPD